jgi:hypothetical protein
MKIFGLIVLFIRRLISYYIEGKAGQLSDIVRLEEGFYHDLKGIYSKRLGLPINKFKAGDHNPAIIEDIESGASEVIKRFSEVLHELFNVLPPDWALVHGYLQLEKLQVAIKYGNIDEIIVLLGVIKQTSDSFYQARVASTRFELGELLANIAKDLKTPSKVTVNLQNLQHSLRLPYTDYNTWKRIVHNIAFNAIEACESKGKDGQVEINLTYPMSGFAKIEVIDNGGGMDAETLANFTKRGYTKGKISGQGLGINEDTIAFLKQHGDFSVTSNLGKGTTIAIEIDSANIAGAQSKVFLIPRKLMPLLRYGGVAFVLISITYFLSKKPPEIYRVEPIDPIAKSQNLAFSGLQTYGEKNKPGWTVHYPPPQNIPVREPVRPVKPFVDDINLDGKNEVVFLLNKGNYPERTENDAVVCLSDQNNEQWRTDFGPPSRAIFDFSLGGEGKFYCMSLVAFDYSGIDTRLIVASASGVYYPDQVMILDGNGKKLKEYWHAGQIASLNELRDFDEDGKLEFVFYGENNRMGWSPVIIVMEYDDFIGQSMPYVDLLFEHAKEERYYLFGHPWIDDSGGFTNISKDDPNIMVASNGVGLYSVTKTMGNYMEYFYDFNTADGRILRFDKNMNLNSIKIDQAQFDSSWNARCNLLGIDRAPNKIELQELYGYRRYIHGDLAVDSIFIHKQKYDYKYWASKLR